MRGCRRELTKEELSGIVRLKRYERETDENERER